MTGRGRVIMMRVKDKVVEKRLVYVIEVVYLVGNLEMFLVFLGIC